MLSILGFLYISESLLTRETYIPWILVDTLMRLTRIQPIDFLLSFE
jgi:hypothetical protein